MVISDLYASVIPILRRFHQLSVIQILLYKHHKCMGNKDWFADSGINAQGSADQGCEGIHYFHSMCLHKEGLGAIAQKNQSLETLLCQVS